MGAHAVPGEMAGQEERYIDFIMEKVLPHVVAEDLAEFCDVFCEQGVFSVDSSRRLLVKAKEMGLKAKLHADEICPFGGAELSGEIEAVSADHLLYASPAGIKAMADNRVIATLLPSTAFCLGEPFADARGMIDQGCAVALASDYNPGSCFTHSLPLVLALACIKMKMTVEEAITAVTLNGAAAVDRAASIGSIEPGKQADILLLQYPSCKFLIYNTGMNIVDKVIKKGRVVYQANKQ
jgi:imidazolonepropionase